MGFFKNVVAAVQGAAQNVVNAAQNVVQSGAQVLNNAGDAAVLAPLLPFKPMMVKALKNKGEQVTITTPMKNVVPLFYKRIVQKQNNIEYNEFENLDEATIQQLLSMVAPILDFIKSIINKKDSGKELSADEKLIYEDANQAADNTVSTGGSVTATGAPSLSGNWIKDNKILIFGVLAVVLFLAFRKK